MADAQSDALDPATPHAHAGHLDGWGALPPDLLLLVLSHAPAPTRKAARATCALWRASIDLMLWRTARGELRNASLGPPPRACLPHLRRLELTFNGCSHTVSDLGSTAADTEAFTKALAGLRLAPDQQVTLPGTSSLPNPSGHKCLLAARPADDAPRVLVLHFGNYCVRASLIERLVHHAAPGLLDAWPRLEVYAHALPSAWPGESSRAGLVLDGGLSGHLSATGAVVGLERQHSISGSSSSSSSAVAAGALTTAEAARQLGLAPSRTEPRGGQGEAAAGSRDEGGTYWLLERCVLPVRRTDLALASAAAGAAPVMAAAAAAAQWATAATLDASADAARRLAARAPALRALRLAAPDAREGGVGARAGGLLRPERVAFRFLPPCVEELEYVGAEMPRVHYSSTHMKPWEAVLLNHPIDYLVKHFVQPAVAAFPRLRRVRCLATRIPQGTELMAELTFVHVAPAWPWPPELPASESGATPTDPDASLRCSESAAVGTAQAALAGSFYAAQRMWKDTERRRAAGVTTRRQVWQLVLPAPPCGDVCCTLEAADGLCVEERDVVFERMSDDYD